MTMDYEKFKEFYQEHNRCINDLQPRKKLLNEIQLKERYNKYSKSEQRRIIKQQEKIQKYFKDLNEFEEEFNGKVDKKWVDTKIQVFTRDQHECRLCLILTDNEYIILKKNGKFLKKIIDPAHIFKVGSNPKIKYDSNYIVCLNRFSHSMLDSYKHPLTGKSISQEDVAYWWKRIVGENIYNILENKLKEKANV